MTKACHSIVVAPNLVADNCSADFSWRDLFVGIFPDNTAAYVASFTRTGVRAVEHVLNGRGGPSCRAFINLLRSPVGPVILDSLLGDTDWRANERRLLRIADLELQLEEQKRRLESLRRQAGE